MKDVQRMIDASVRVPMQVLELLSHVNKRVKGHDDIKLPFLALLEVYNQSTGRPLVCNFSLVYVEMACERTTAEERFEAVSCPSYQYTQRVLLSLQCSKVSAQPSFPRIAWCGVCRPC